MSASHRKKYNQEPKSSSRTQCNAIPLAPLRCVSRCLLLSQRWCMETDSFRGFTMGFLIQKVGLKGFKLDSDIQEIKDELKVTWTWKKKSEPTNLNRSRIRDVI